MKPQKLLLIFVLSALFALSACAKAPETRSAADVPTAPEVGDRSKDFGDHIVHFNAVTTDQLSQEAARMYGISRSKSQALLNVVINEKTGDSTSKSTSGKVSANANNLTGQLKNLTIREITDGNATYYIGQISVADKEHLTFNIEVVPMGETKPLNVSFQQQFFTK